MKYNIFSSFDSHIPSPILDRYCLSTGLEPQVKFEDGQPTGEIIAYKAWFSQNGLPPFQVKFESEVALPNYMTMVEFDNLEACEVGYNVYFRATDIKEVK